jgi:hypothetical protein
MRQWIPAALQLRSALNTSFCSPGVNDILVSGEGRNCSDETERADTGIFKKYEYIEKVPNLTKMSKVAGSTREGRMHWQYC